MLPGAGHLSRHLVSCHLRWPSSGWYHVGLLHLHAPWLIGFSTFLPSKSRYAVHKIFWLCRMVFWNVFIFLQMQFYSWQIRSNVRWKFSPTNKLRGISSEQNAWHKSLSGNALCDTKPSLPSRRSDLCCKLNFSFWALEKKVSDNISRKQSWLSFQLYSQVIVIENRLYRKILLQKNMSLTGLAQYK